MLHFWQKKPQPVGTPVFKIWGTPTHRTKIMITGDVIMSQSLSHFPPKHWLYTLHTLQEPQGISSKHRATHPAPTVGRTASDGFHDGREGSSSYGVSRQGVRKHGWWWAALWCSGFEGPPYVHVDAQGLGQQLPLVLVEPRDDVHDAGAGGKQKAGRADLGRQRLTVMQLELAEEPRGMEAPWKYFS